MDTSLQPSESHVPFTLLSEGTQLPTAHITSHHITSSNPITILYSHLYLKELSQDSLLILWSRVERIPCRYWSRKFI